MKGSVLLKARELEVQSLQSLGNQRFSPEARELEVQSYQRFRNQRFSLIRGSGIRGSVLLEVRELEVQSYERFRNQRCSPIRGTTIKDQLRASRTDGSAVHMKKGPFLPGGSSSSCSHGSKHSQVHVQCTYRTCKHYVLRCAQQLHLHLTKPLFCFWFRREKRD